MIYVVGALLLLCSFQFGIGETEESDYIYVDDDNITEPWDGSMENPYRCIQDAVENASEGDTVFVFNGFYSGNIRIDKSLDLVGEDSQSTIVDGGNILFGFLRIVCQFNNLILLVLQDFLARYMLLVMMHLSLPITSIVIMMELKLMEYLMRPF